MTTAPHHPGALIAVSGSVPPRVPVSALVSVVLHVALFALWLHVNQAKKESVHVIADVDLMIQPKRALPAPQAAPPVPAQKLSDFLKLALPAVPKVEPQQLQSRAPELKRAPLPAPEKLDDRGRRVEGPKLEPLDLSRQKADLAKIESQAESRRATQALAALPRLEEVGRRQVRNLPQALALEEKRQEAASLQRLQGLTPQPTARARPQAMEALREAEPQPGRSGSKISERLTAMLPAERALPAQQQAIRPAPSNLAKKLESEAPAAQRREAGLQRQEKQKGVEIEGPLADRKVLAYHIPEFPEWARDQGMLEAAVSIRFWVSKDGEVLPNMRVEHTSGYGRLDRLAMESLRQWRFAPLAAEERQWGVITFRFILE